MRNFIAVFLIALSTILYGQNIDTIKTSISHGNATKIASYFSETIELSILEEDGFYSKKQAQIVLDNFFKSNKPTSFVIKHKGGSKSKSQFIIGTLNAKDKTFRTHILYNNLNGKINIIEFRIESQD